MRTSIDIDDALWDEIKSLTGVNMKKKALETVFREYIKMKRREELSALTNGMDGFDLELSDLKTLRDG
ncbi:MAG: type II toxin-antitoxin system VapB family antitoxin [Candidatus Marinimicrobia bacterium]|nr:type II toxin-antitoxin system VapB family antitoxin [Candidatus Neomarinimicrobiota bacterium]